MAKVAKTNAMRLLDSNKIIYNIYTYDNKDGKIDGVSVAEKIGKDPSMVYKTLVAMSGTKKIYVFVIPVEKELDLKKAASVAGEKKIDMIPVKDIQSLTGYIRGGCSPFGMKKVYPTFIQEEGQSFEHIVVSGGKIGIQVEVAPTVFGQVIGATYADVVKHG